MGHLKVFLARYNDQGVPWINERNGQPSGLLVEGDLVFDHFEKLAATALSQEEMLMCLKNCRVVEVDGERILHPIRLTVKPTTTLGELGHMSLMVEGEARRKILTSMELLICQRYSCLGIARACEAMKKLKAMASATHNQVTEAFIRAVYWWNVYETVKALRIRVESLPPEDIRQDAKSLLREALDKMTLAVPTVPRDREGGQV